MSHIHRLLCWQPGPQHNYEANGRFDKSGLFHHHRNKWDIIGISKFPAPRLDRKSLNIMHAGLFLTFWGLQATSKQPSLQPTSDSHM
ncbi:unnamed protein product [Gadus morhua 'NCC']